MTLHDDALVLHASILSLLTGQELGGAMKVGPRADAALLLEALTKDVTWLRQQSDEPTRVQTRRLRVGWDGAAIEDYVRREPCIGTT